MAEQAAESTSQKLDPPIGSGLGVSPLLFSVSSQQSQQPHKRILFHLSIWMAISLAFATVLFYLVPRHAQPWYGPNQYTLATTGFSKSIELGHDELIQESNELIFQASFQGWGNRPNAAQSFTRGPYYRGLALSNLVIKDGKTGWEAPYDRVYSGAYQRIQNLRRSANRVKQIITLEKTTEPLLYSCMPVYRIANSPRAIEFCHEVSALTRCRAKDKITTSPYEYELGTLVDERGDLCQAWPYVSNSQTYRQLPMSHDPGQKSWLTDLEPARYPYLIREANRMADGNPARSRIEIVRALEKYFHSPQRFEYTLDYRDFDWNPTLDPVEDFVKNHHKGHCEMFASAMVLMLRSQGIPARLVVGFYRGDYNHINGKFLVRGKHAHAWVEVYLRPEDCTLEMKQRGESGTGGAWLIADPTPASGSTNSDTTGIGAINMARSVWRDYVIGMETPAAQNGVSPLSVPLVRLLQGMEIDEWESSITNFTNSLSNRVIRQGIGAILLLIFLIRVFFISRKEANNRSQGHPTNSIRKMMAGAISLVSPRLGEWMHPSHRHILDTAFYRRLSDCLARHGLVREPYQTHREFANQASQSFVNHPAAQSIQEKIDEITDAFNLVRYGQRTLSIALRQQYESSADELQQLLRSEVTEFTP